MGAKKSLTLRIDAAAILSYCFVSFLILILDELVFRNSNLAQKIFSLPGTLSKSAAENARQIGEVLGEGAKVQGEEIFNFQNPLHYFRLILYVFGSKSVLQFLLSFAFVLPLGVQMEERYGSAAIVVMIAITTVVTGVLNACLIPASLCGAGAVAFMLIFLFAITSLSKNELPASAIFIFALFFASEFYSNEILSNTKVVAIIAKIAGGLCGSMIGFLTAPKARRSQPSPASNSAAAYAESPANKKARQSFLERLRQEKAKKKFDEETTVIGSVEI